MTILETIERISPPDRSLFEREYIAGRRPVIIRGLFRGQPIERASTLGRARDKLGDTPVQVVSEYNTDFLETSNLLVARRRQSTLGQYLQLLKENPSSPMVVAELPTPPQVSSLMDVPAVCDYRCDADRANSGIISKVYVAGRGNIAHLHFDGDYRHVLLHQVFGRKRVCLIRPEKAAVLLPILNSSLLNIECMSDRERAAFLKFVGGYDVILYPGETIYIPPLWWHFLQYMDIAMSVSLRFGRSGTGRMLYERFHPNMHLQNIAWKGFLGEKLGSRARKYFRRIIAEYNGAGYGGFSLYLRMQRLFESIYQDFCSESVQGAFWHPLPEFAHRQARTFIKAGILYPSRRRIQGGCARNS